MVISGCDLSYCQAGISYNDLKRQGIKFAIIRAGHGLKEDTELRRHVTNVLTQGIPFGLYWFIESNTVAGVKAEAQKLISVIEGFSDKLQYPVYFDLEDVQLVKNLTRAEITDLADAFCTELLKAGLYPGIYTNPDWLNNRFDKSRIVDKWDIWLAHYTYSPDKPSSYDFGQAIHQWGIFNSVSSNGSNMQVDGDNCYIDYPSRITAWREERAKMGKVNSIIQNTQNSISASQHFNRGSKVSLYGIPIYANAADISPIRTVLPDNTEYEVVTGLSENGRLQICSQTNVNDKFYVDLAALRLAGNANVKISYTDAQITAIARQVIAGKFGSGETRKKLLAKYGYPVDLVQAKVNELLFGKK